MKNQKLIPLLILPLTFAACKEKQSPSTENNSTQPAEAPTNNTPTDPAPAEVDIIEEPAPGTQGAVIGAAAGAIIGHQSGNALEGAAIGGIIGAPPEIEEETENTQRE